jgi:hypothetical protein
MRGKTAWVWNGRIFIDKYIFMRYKQNMMDKLEQAETLVSRLDIQLSRNASQEQIFETLEALKEQLDSAKEMVSIESDDFEQQFADR